MLEVLKFILKLVAEFISMLFSIDIGNGLSLGFFMCIVFIFFPLFLKFINFIKVTYFDERDESHDSSRNK